MHNGNILYLPTGGYTGPDIHKNPSNCVLKISALHVLYGVDIIPE